MAAQVFLSGAASHTHGPGDSLVKLAWKDIATGYTVSVNAPSLTCFLPFGAYTVSLTVTDNNGASDSTTPTFVVASDAAADGTLLEIFKGGSVGALPAKAVYAALTSGTPFAVQPNDVPAGLSGAVILRMLAKTYFPLDTMSFSITGAGVATVWIAVDGKVATAFSDLAVGAGQHTVDVRCASAAAVVHALDAAAAGAGQYDLSTRASCRIALSSPGPVALKINNAAPSTAVSDISQHYPVINSIPFGTTVEPGDFALINGVLHMRSSRGRASSFGTRPPLDE